LLGRRAAEVQMDYRRRDGQADRQIGRFRIGSYTPAVDGTTRWLAVDCDGGAAHGSPLADPTATALRIVAAVEALGLPVSLEKSGGGKGWHVWILFSPAVPATKVRALGFAICPRDALLTDGTAADPERGHGLEIFPKSNKIKVGGVGGMVWLPWWDGARGDANWFFRRRPDGALEAYVPTDFSTATEAELDAALARLGVTVGAEPRRRKPTTSRAQTPVRAATKVPAAAPPTETALAPTSTDGDLAQSSESADDEPWRQWRHEALATLDLSTVYGDLLTGGDQGGGWLECRDPSSPSGDRSPSAGVADGSGDVERGTFHSFRDGRSLSIFDFLVERGLATDFRAACEFVAELSGVPVPATRHRRATDDKRIEIVLGTDEKRVIDEAIAALAECKAPIFQRGGFLVRVVSSPTVGTISRGETPRIEILPEAALRTLLTDGGIEVGSWITDADGNPKWKREHPPTWLVRGCAATAEWTGIRPLTGVISTPTLRPDGSLLVEPRYDAATGLLLAPTEPIDPIPDAPTRADALRAVEQLLETVCDFPFAGDEHRSAWLALVGTIMLRHLIDGPSPLFLVDANVRGAGKSLLASVAVLIATGREPPVASWAADESEQRKLVTSLALAGDSVCLLDNVTGVLGGGPMNAALTSTGWQDRILGQSRTTGHLPWRCVLIATGNNCSLAPDTPRRTLPIRLESSEERPEDRDGFRRSDLVAWVRDERHRFAAAALVIARAWHVAGRPTTRLRPMALYTAWTSMIRQPLAWLGLSDPAETQRSPTAPEERDRSELVGLIEGIGELADEEWLTAAEIIERIGQAPGGTGETLRGVLSEHLPARDGKLPGAKALGTRLRRYVGRVVGGRAITTRAGRAGRALWRVEPAKGPRGEP
ncbi:MAG: hypothetical protein V2A73_16890, partial [Pseudomonadota bacterium]